MLSGFTIVRNATILDFPIEASILSVLPVVEEFIVNVGVSDDDTLARVQAIPDPKVRIIETKWDRSRGGWMLSDESERARRECAGSWGIYIQADEVLGDGGAQALAAAITQHDGDLRVEGILVNYVHFYAGFDTVATNRSWYRSETRAVRLRPEMGIHSYHHAQGFRVGLNDRRIRCVRSGATMLHYGWARPAWAIAAKRAEDREIYPWRKQQDALRPLLPWIPGIRRFTGRHPVVADEWIRERRTTDQLVSPRRWEAHHAKLVLSGAIERISGWRPFEYRNYEIVR